MRSQAMNCMGYLQLGNYRFDPNKRPGFTVMVFWQSMFIYFSARERYSIFRTTFFSSAKIVYLMVETARFLKRNVNCDCKSSRKKFSF